MFDIAIVIVSWNTRDVLRQCLESLSRACEGLSCQVFVVDNASSDGTPEMVRREFAGVTVVRNLSNLGFAKANNIGIRLAHARYLCLVNSDVIVPAGCLPKMLAHMESHPEVGLLGPRMLDAGGVPGASCMRRPTLAVTLVNALGLAGVFKRYRLHMDNYRSEAAQEVDVLNGWFWMARSIALDDVGPLEEEFFMYGEDIDWCHRFWQAGWRVVYFPEASATHLGGASSARAPVRFYVEMHRANMQYWRRHHSPASQAVYYALSVLHHAVRVVGYGAAYLLLPARRGEAGFKVARSAACLGWLLGIRTPGPRPASEASAAL